MPKELGPIAALQKEADQAKKQVEQLVKECNKLLGNKKLKDDEEKLKDCFKRCYEQKKIVDDLAVRAEALTEEGEPTKVKNFVNKKKTEVGRIGQWQKSLDTTMGKLLPDEKGENYLKELKGGDEQGEDEEEEEGEEEEVEEEEEEVEEEEVEEEEEEDDEYEQTDTKNTMQTTAATEMLTTGAEEEDEDDEEEEEEEDEEEDETDKKSKLAKKQTDVDADEEDDEEGEEEEEEEDDDEEEEEDDEEEEDEEDEDDEKDKDEKEKKKDKKKKKQDKKEDELEVTTSGQQFKALYDYAGEQKGDLKFSKGEILTIVDTREDGWWEAENESGERGIVPSTFLKMYNKYENVQQDDDEDEEEKEDEDEEEEGEDGVKPKKKKSKWSSIRKAVTESGVSDVLHALGAVPSGFRASTLGPKFEKDETYRMANFLMPKLSASNLAYSDLYLDPTTSKIRPRSSKIERIITITNCRQIPLPGTGLEVLGRHVRVCLFDGHNVLSNIHTVKVASTDKEQRTWAFSNRVYDNVDPYQFSEVFTRSNHTPDNIGVLFELCVSYVRTLTAEEQEYSKSTKEHGEFSCGWAHLPFIEPNGNVIGNRQFDLYVNGGTPYEKGVEVDPSISRRTTSSGFMSLLSGNKQPRLIVKVAIPKKEQKDLLDLTPDVLVGNVILLPFYSYYRQKLADVLLRDRLDLESTELIHNPVLATFPKVADQHDMMKLFRDAWIEKTKTVKRSEFRDNEYMKDLFSKVVMETLYPVLHTATVPSYLLGDMSVEQERHDEIVKFKKQKQEKKDILALLLSSEIQFTPFSTKEVSFDIIGPHCLDRINVPVHS